MAKFLIIAGLALLVAGTIWLVGEKLGLGRLPGDIVIERENFKLYLPLASSILVSAILSLIVWLIGRL